MTPILATNLFRKEPVRCFMETYLAAHDTVYGALEPEVLQVPVARIIGVHARCKETVRGYKPVGADASSRVRQARRALHQGKLLQPLQLYQIESDFYVIDGLPQVAAAKALHLSNLPAQVMVYRTVQDNISGILSKARAEFHRHTGLADIWLSHPESYDILRNQLTAHRVFLESSGGRLWSQQEAISGWVQTIYSVIAEGIIQENLVEELPGFTTGDIFMFLSAFAAQEGERAGIAPSAALLDLINVTHTSWRNKARALLPRCFFEKSCPFA